MMSIFKKKTLQMPFDRERQIPVIRASICTGEQVACFKDKNTGQLEEVMLVNNQIDLNCFLEMYNLRPEDVKKEY